MLNTMSSMFLTLVLLLSACAAEHIHSHKGHQCMHDSVVEGARAHWKKHGLDDRFSFSAASLNPHGASQSVSRRLQSFSNIRILIKTDLLVDGAYVCLEMPTCCFTAGFAQLPLLPLRLPLQGFAICVRRWRDVC